MLSFQITIIIIIIVFLIILLSLINTYLKENKHNKTKFKPIIKYFNYDKYYDPIESYDRNKINDELEAPRKRSSREEYGLYNKPPNKYNFLPFNYPMSYPTHGRGDNYHLYGYLTKIDDNEDKNKELTYNDLYSLNPNNINQNKTEEKENTYDPLKQENQWIKLYGRRKYPNSNVYQYYTSINLRNDNIKVDIDEDKRLMDNDIVNVKNLGKYKVNLYKNEEIENFM